MALRKKNITIPIYNISTMLVEVDNTQELNDKLDLDLTIKHLLGVTFIRKKDDLLILVLNVNHKDLNHGGVAHECVHAAIRICTFLEIKLDKNNHEPLAYLVDWLVDECYKFFKFNF